MRCELPNKTDTLVLQPSYKKGAFDSHAVDAPFPFYHDGCYYMTFIGWDSIGYRTGIARYENGAWVSHQVTDWDYRWDFQGHGSIIFHIRLGSVSPRAGYKHKLVMPYKHIKYGKRLLILDEKTLKPLGTAKPASRYPSKLCKPEDKFPDMQVHWRGDLGSAGKQGMRYVLRWETLLHNRDRPRKPPLPAPSMLRVYKLSARGVARKLPPEQKSKKTE